MPEWRRVGKRRPLRVSDGSEKPEPLAPAALLRFRPVSLLHFLDQKPRQPRPFISFPVVGGPTPFQAEYFTDILRD